MKKLGIIFILIFNLCFSQTHHTLKFKFDERYFLSNFITSKTSNPFILKVFKESDSIADLDKSKNYIDILDSTLKNNIASINYEKEFANSQQKIEFDSLKATIGNGDFLKIFKNAVKANFNSEFLDESLNHFGIKNYKIIATDYNQFSISFSDQINLKKTQEVFRTNRLSFHQALELNELEKIQNCFMKENDLMVKNNYLKKENDYLLIYKDDANLFGDSYKQSKCFDSNMVTFLLNKGEEHDVFSKLFFVQVTNDLAKDLVNSIVAYDFGSQNNKDSDGQFVFITILFNKKGQYISTKFSQLNAGKDLFFGDKSKFLMDSKIMEKSENGKILLKVDLFKKNWQQTFELVRFAAFRNSSIIE